MNFIKDILIDFLLFSGLEGFIFCLLFHKVFTCKKFKFYQWLLLASVNCIISQIFPPVVYQLIILVWIASLLFLINKDIKFIKCLLISFLSILFFFVLETPYEILLSIILKFEAFNMFLTDLEFLKLFILIIPLRVIEMLLIKKIGDNKAMKIVIGGVVRK